MRVIILRLMGVNVGNDVFIGFNCDFDTNVPELITIEDHVTISHGCMIYAHIGTSVNTLLRDKFPLTCKKVVLREGSWIAIGSIILPGVTIGKEVFVAAGSVVTKDIPDRTMVGGIPARFIKEIK